MVLQNSNEGATATQSLATKLFGLQHFEFLLLHRAALHIFGSLPGRLVDVNGFLWDVRILIELVKRDCLHSLSTLLSTTRRNQPIRPITPRSRATEPGLVTPKPHSVNDLGPTPTPDPCDEGRVKKK